MKIYVVYGWDESSELSDDLDYDLPTPIDPVLLKGFFNQKQAEEFTKNNNYEYRYYNWQIADIDLDLESIIKQLLGNK